MDFILLLLIHVMISGIFATFHYTFAQKSKRFSILRIVFVGTFSLFITLWLGMFIYTNLHAYVLLMLFFLWIPLTFISFVSSVLIEEIATF